MSDAEAGKLREMILQENWEALDLARALGAEATGVAASLLENDNEEVRFLATSAVVEGGGPDAARHLLSVMTDEDEQIRATASQALLRYPPEGRLEEAWSAFNEVDDPALRYNIGLSLGLTGTDTSRELLTALASLPANEPESTADALLGALARRGNAEGIRQLGERIGEAEGPRAAGVLQVFHYVGNPRLLKQLRPLLDRYEVAVDLSSHVHSLQRRTCDLAIDEIVDLAPGALGFPKAPDRSYAEEEIQQARAYLDGLPGPA